VADLVRRLGDHSLDAARPQVPAVRAGGVGLVAAQQFRCRARPTGSQPRDAELVKKSW
jgi:hypothetical protein